MSEETRGNKINRVLRRHFNRYFKEQHLQPYQNEWSALRRALNKLIANEVSNALDNLEKCNHCNGDGFTSEHDPQDPHESGCSGGCPIQVQCDNCQAKGFVLKGHQQTDNNQGECNEDDLPF